jgi:hypothetical protein
MDRAVLALRTSNQFIPVRAEMDPSAAARTAEFQRGEGVTMICRVQGRFVGAPSLNGCQF